MSEKVCGGPPNFRYTWPGKDEAYICLPCAATLANIAAAMGLHVQFVPVDYIALVELDEIPTCPQHVTEEVDA